MLNANFSIYNGMNMKQFTVYSLQGIHLQGKFGHYNSGIFLHLHNSLEGQFRVAIVGRWPRPAALRRVDRLVAWFFFNHG